MVSIRKASMADAESLSDILNTDQKLRDKLGMTELETVTADQFLDEIVRWETEKLAISFAILQGRAAIGLISLSKIDHDKKMCYMGNWLASSLWDKGIGTEAMISAVQNATDLASFCPQKTAAR